MALLKNKNFAFSLLAADLAIDGLAITMTASDGAKFPQTGYFMATLWDAAIGAPGLDPDRELVKCTFTSGDTFAIVRAQEGTTAKAWITGDNVALVFTAGKMDEIEKALQTGSASFSIATGTNTYAATHDPALSAYFSGLAVNIKFVNACTGNATLNINALGAKKIYKFENGSYSLLASGDIQAAMFSTLFYNADLDSAAGGWILITHRVNIPTDFTTGDIILYLKSGTPTGWTIKVDWAANTSVIVGNSYSSGGGSDSPTSWETAIAVVSHAPHTHTGPSHDHIYTDVIAHTHTIHTEANLNGSAGSGWDTARWPVINPSGAGRVTGSTGNAFGTTQLSGTANTGNPSATLTHSVTQDTYTPRYTIAVAIVKD